MNDKDQLESLLNKYRKVGFAFEFPGLSQSENQSWHKRIKKNYYACGCNVGKTFMMYALLITSLGLLFIHFFKKDKLSIMMYVYCFLFIFLMAGVGKTVGKMMAYKNLEKDIIQLKNYLLFRQNNEGL